MLHLYEDPLFYLLISIQSNRNITRDGLFQYFATFLPCRFCRKEKNKTSFSFCLEGDWCRGVKVDRTGKGLLQVWKRQIQQFNRVSLEMANAIVARYPSPLLLMQARFYISIIRYIQCAHANSYSASKRNLKSHVEILRQCKKKRLFHIENLDFGSKLIFHIFCWISYILQNH